MLMFGKRILRGSMAKKRYDELKKGRYYTAKYTWTNLYTPKEPNGATEEYPFVVLDKEKGKMRVAEVDDWSKRRASVENWPEQMREATVEFDDEVNAKYLARLKKYEKSSIIKQGDHLVAWRTDAKGRRLVSYIVIYRTDNDVMVIREDKLQLDDKGKMIMGRCIGPRKRFHVCGVGHFEYVIIDGTNFYKWNSGELLIDDERGHYR